MDTYQGIREWRRKQGSGGLDTYRFVNFVDKAGSWDTACWVEYLIGAGNEAGGCGVTTSSPFCLCASTSLLPLLSGGFTLALALEVE